MPFLKQRTHFKQSELWLAHYTCGLTLSQEKAEQLQAGGSGVTLLVALICMEVLPHP